MLERKLPKTLVVGPPGFDPLLDLPNNTSNGSVKSVRISPDNSLIAIGACDERARIFDLATAEVVVDLQHEGNRNALPNDDQDSNVAIEAVAWSSDSKYLFTSGLIDGVMRIWRRDDWPLVGWEQAQETNRAIEMIAVHGDRVAVGGDEGVARIYDFSLPTIQPRYSLPTHANSWVTIEAEDFDTNLQQGTHRWDMQDAPEAVGGTLMRALPGCEEAIDHDSTMRRQAALFFTAYQTINKQRLI